MKFPVKLTFLAVLVVLMGLGACAYAFFAAAPTPVLSNVPWISEIAIQRTTLQAAIAFPEASSLSRSLNQAISARRLLQQSA